MPRFAIIVAGAASALVAVPAVAAPVPAPATAWAPQGWQTINQRQANLYNRIEQGVRSGALNRNEAYRLRSRFVALERLERDYRRSGRGLTVAERRDLDRRFDALSGSIRVQKTDRQGWRR